MNKLTVTDVRIVPGDSGFLIDDGETAILYDTGFGFTGHQMAEKIHTLLGARSLDYIFLTHSHYDHALGSAAILRRYPGAKVMAAEYARRIFEKPTARATMLELDQKAALSYGFAAAADDGLRVDLPVQDGDILICGKQKCKVVSLPGHTRCSVGFWLEEQRLLLGTETLGVYFGNGTCLPSFLVGYEWTLQSFQKAKALGAEQLLVPHYGLLCGNAVNNFLEESEKVTVFTASQIRRQLEAGAGEETILQELTAAFYAPHVEPVYPRDAFLLNTTIMIRLIQKESVCR